MTRQNLIPKDSVVLDLDPDEIVTIKGTHDRTDYGDIEGLKESIKKDGQIQPITVMQRKVQDRIMYIVVTGRRRRLACKQLGIKVKCLVVEPDDKTHLLDLQIAENVFRKDFDTLELAEALALRKKAYEEENKDSIEAGLVPQFVQAMAKARDVSPNTIKRLMEPANLPDEIREKIKRQPVSTAERNYLVREAIRLVKEKKAQFQYEKKRIQRTVGSGKDLVKRSEMTRVYNGEYKQILKTHIPERSVGLVLTYPTPDIKTDWIEKIVPYLAVRGTVVVLCDHIDTAYEYKVAMQKAGLFIREGFHACLEFKNLGRKKARKDYKNSMIYMVRGCQHYNYIYNPSQNLPNHGQYRSKGWVDGVVHPRCPPTAYLRDIIKDMSAAYHTILDPFANVGFTVYEATKLNRKVIGIESDPTRFAYAKNRISTLIRRMEDNESTEDLDNTGEEPEDGRYDREEDDEIKRDTEGDPSEGTQET